MNQLPWVNTLEPFQQHVQALQVSPQIRTFTFRGANPNHDDPLNIDRFESKPEAPPPKNKLSFVKKLALATAGLFLLWPRSPIPFLAHLSRNTATSVVTTTGRVLGENMIAVSYDRFGFPISHVSRQADSTFKVYRLGEYIGYIERSNQDAWVYTPAGQRLGAAYPSGHYFPERTHIAGHPILDPVAAFYLDEGGDLSGSLPPDGLSMMFPTLQTVSSFAAPGDVNGNGEATIEDEQFLRALKTALAVLTQIA